MINEGNEDNDKGVKINIENLEYSIKFFNTFQLSQLLKRKENKGRIYFL